MATMHFLCLLPDTIPTHTNNPIMTALRNARLNLTMTLQHALLSRIPAPDHKIPESQQQHSSSRNPAQDTFNYPTPFGFQNATIPRSGNWNTATRIQDHHQTRVRDVGFSPGDASHVFDTKATWNLLLVALHPALQRPGNRRSLIWNDCPNHRKRKEHHKS